MNVTVTVGATNSVMASLYKVQQWRGCLLTPMVIVETTSRLSTIVSGMLVKANNRAQASAILKQRGYTVFCVNGIVENIITKSNDGLFDIIKKKVERIKDDRIPYSIDIDLDDFVNVKSRKDDGSLKNDNEIWEEARVLFIEKLQAYDFNLGEMREYPQEGK